MTELRKALEVIQADRDAAADYLETMHPCVRWDQGSIDGVCGGQGDDLSLVQAFARHRHAALASQSPPPTDDVRARARQRLATEIEEARAHVFYEPVVELSLADAEALSETGDERTLILNGIAVMMSEFVDNWPNPKRVKTALALIAKILRAALSAQLPPPIRGEGLREQIARHRDPEVWATYDRACASPSVTHPATLRISQSLEAADAILAIPALAKALATPSSPEGWVLVPRELTKAMEEAHFCAHAKAETIFADAAEVWAAMLAASPSSKENKS